MKKLALGLMAALALLMTGCGKKATAQETPPADQFFANAAVARSLITNARVKIKHETTMKYASRTLEATIGYNGRIDRNPTTMLGNISLKTNVTEETVEYKYFSDKTGSYLQDGSEWIGGETTTDSAGFEENSIDSLAFGPDITAKKEDWIKKTELSREGSDYVVNFKLSPKEVKDYLKIDSLTKKVDYGLKLKSLDFRVTYDGKTYRPTKSRIKFNYEYDSDKYKSKDDDSEEVSYSQTLTFELSDFNQDPIKKPDVSDATKQSKNDDDDYDDDESDDDDSKSSDSKKKESDSDKAEDAAFILGKSY